MRRIRKKADDFFEQQGLILPLNLEQLTKAAKNMKWEIYSYSEAANLITYLQSLGHTDILNNKGFTYKQSNSGQPTTILYKDDLSIIEKIKVISHEIGHIVLEHTSLNGILGKSESRYVESEQEKEANEFELEFQAPIPVLRKMNISSADEIVNLEILDEEDAWKQIAYMHKSVKINRKRTINQNKNIIIAVTMFFVVLFGGIILWQQQERDISGNSPAETTTQYISGVYDETTLSEDKLLEKVYITHSGEKYHRADCQYVKDRTNIIELTIGEAKKAGYEPCKVCRPDETD